MTLKHADGLARAFGYLLPEELNGMEIATRRTCEKFTYPVIVNIGAGAGTSALAFREACPNALLVTVDVSPGGPLGGMEGERNAFASTDLQLPLQILNDSKALGHDWQTPVHLLFIDGDHTYAGITGDIEAWCGHVPMGGFILFHDYGSHNWPEVAPVVDEFVAQNHDKIETFGLYGTLFVVELAED